LQWRIDIKNNFLIVDLDCSLLKIDLFKELLGKSLIYHPWQFIQAICFALKNKAKAKRYIAERVNIDPSELPYNQRVIDLILEYRKKGYKIVLATGAPKNFACAIANYLQLFDKVLATEDINNVGINKLKLIKEQANKNFIYVSDSKKDLPIWFFCKKAILIGKIGKNKFIENKLKSNRVDILDIIIENKSYFKLLFRQLRVHQWSKNILLFVPAIASHQIYLKNIFINTFQGFLAFSLIASSVYIFNDIVDIDNDRKHPDKKNRCIAAGDLSIFSAYGILFLCFIGGIYLSLDFSIYFFLIIAIYIMLNMLYSFRFKKIIIIDIIFLMTFYTIRLIAGHIPNVIPLSPWLLAFSIFLFFSLGLLKRYVDTIITRENNQSIISGRGYSINDGNMIMSLGVGSGLISTLVIILYTGSEQVQQFYLSPMILIALAPLMLYWISWMWLMAERGKIIIDPVLFTLKNINSYIVVLCSIIIIFLAKYLPI